MCIITVFIKARKLEFLLAEAIQENCDCVITCGGLQSNFCRTVAVACRQLGLECHLLLRCPGNKVLCCYNILSFCGAEKFASRK